MSTCTFVHAADLHLDAPFRGLNQHIKNSLKNNESFIHTLQQATFIALERLVSTCIEHQARFLLLAGDIYNSEQGTLKAYYALQKAFTDLAEHNIQVFLAHGNHDPLLGGKHPWPENVTVFGPEAETHTVRHNAELVALVHGISHANKEESRNLVAALHRTTSATTPQHLLQVGVVHCAVQGSQGEHAVYAPCTEGDLHGTGLDYLALGHVHGSRLFYRQSDAKPFAAYAGSLQGLHINETGPHGCYVLQAENSHITQSSFIPLAPLVWEKILVDVQAFAPLSENAAQALGGLEDIVLPAIENHLKSTEIHAGRAPSHASGNIVIYRLYLTGKSDVYGAMHDAAALETVREHINANVSHLPVFVHSLVSRVQPIIDAAAMQHRTDLVGTIWNMAENWLCEPALLQQETDAFAQTWQKKIKNTQRALPESSPEELRELVEQARLMCLHKLEVR